LKKLVVCFLTSAAFIPLSFSTGHGSSSPSLSFLFFLFVFSPSSRQKGGTRGFRRDELEVYTGKMESRSERGHLASDYKRVSINSRDSVQKDGSKIPCFARAWYKTGGAATLFVFSLLFRQEVGETWALLTHLLFSCCHAPD